MSTSAEKKLLIVICGPTATGKTGLSVDLAKRLQTEVLSADSRQFFKEMLIGTARTTEVEMNGVEHHLSGHLSVSENYSAGMFEREALQTLSKLFSKKSIVIMCGGSGLYIKAVCEGIDYLPEISEQIREQLNEEFDKEGMDYLRELAEKSDPDFYKTIDKNNPRRLIRMLEVFRASGKPISFFYKKEKASRPFEILKIGLEMPREKLYERINLRVDKMIESGLVEEVKSLEKHWNHPNLKTVGYQEIIAHLRGETDLNTAIEEIKKNSRRYAKRQFTWFRNDKTINWFDTEEKDSIFAFVYEKIKLLQ
ncbi:MAG: tRNA (adenosine(37)-N6)-dimethylallyltransferase MiaA [Chitinophagaceae bacterium]|nr:MAG: tRNA (adenosine(37)-N6)-dimethylallyltransferase MiaA [Chitinophagaceae bacterium]